MPLWVFELTTITLFIATAIWVSVRPFKHNLQTIRRLILRILCCYGACLPLVLMTRYTNLSLIIVLKSCVFVSIVTWLSLSPILRPARKRLKNKPQRRFSMGNMLLIMLLLLAGVIAMDLVAMLIPRSLFLDETSHSFVLRHLAKTHQPQIDEQQKQLDAIMAQQNQFFSHISQTAQQSRNWLYDVTGIDQLVKQIGALQEVLSLSHAQRAQIISNSKPLSELTNHPLIIDIVSNPELIKLINQAGEGHMQALWQLQKHPTITALMNDHKLHQQMIDLDLHAILKQHRENQWDKQALLPVIWYSTVLDSSSQLQTALADSNRWQKSGQSLSWDRATDYAAITAELHAKPQTKIILRFKTTAHLKAYIDDQPIQLLFDGQTHHLQLTSQGKPIAICLLLDSRSTSSKPTCEIQVLAK